MKYKINLKESNSYRDFNWIFDKDLGVYVMLLNPISEKDIVERDKDVIFINKSKENEKDSIDDVISYIDDYYDNLEDSKYNSNELIEEAENSDMFSGLYMVRLIKSEDDSEEIVEFTGKDALKNAQDYIDRLKIDNDEFFKRAILLDSDENPLDFWEYSER